MYRKYGADAPMGRAEHPSPIPTGSKRARSTVHGTTYLVLSASKLTTLYTSILTSDLGVSAP